MGTREHKKKAPCKVAIGVLTASTSRCLAEDKSGKWICSRAKKEGHAVLFHQLVPDDAETIKQAVVNAVETRGVQVVLITGGTGISAKDVTIEALRPLFDRELTAFGSLFAMLSFEQIDSAAILSRAMAGVIGGTAVFCLPGSLKACRLACKALIFPEIGHLVKHLGEP